MTDAMMSRAMKMEQIGSTIFQPKFSTRREDIITPTLPSVSASTWRNTPGVCGGGCVCVCVRERERLTLYVSIVRVSMGTLRVAVVVTESENPNQIHEKPSHRHNLTRTSHFTNSEHCVRTI